MSGIPNRIVSAPAAALVAMIASRREMRPSGPGSAMSAAIDEASGASTAEAVVVTISSPTAVRFRANSEVSLVTRFVAVAVT